MANDDAAQICSRSLSLQRPSFSDLNRVIATYLALTVPYLDVLTVPGLKMLSVRAAPVSLKQLKYYAVQSTARQMILTGSCSDSQMDYSVTRKNCSVKYFSGQLNLFGSFKQSQNDQGKSELLKYQSETKNLEEVCRDMNIFRGQEC